MAAEIKGITIELNGDTSNLQKALREVRKETKGFEKELSYIEDSLKFNPKNIDLLKQKMAVLNDATKAGEKNITQMKKALAEMKAAGVSETSAEYRELQREIIKAENKQKSYNAELKKLKSETSALGQASKKMADLGNAATKAGEALRGLSAAGAAIDVALAGLAYKSGQAADDLNTLSKVTGISTDELQKYAAASDLVDVSVETLAKSQTKLKKSMATAAEGFDTLTVAEDGSIQGGNKTAKAFEKLGVAVTNANGELRGQDEVFQDVIEALSKMSNETERDALAQQIFGKSAAELNPLIEDNGETYKRVAEIFANNGLEIVDEETLQKANEFNDQLDIIKATWGAAINTIGMQLAGYLAPALETVGGWLQKFAGWLSQLSPETLAVIGVIAGIVAGLSPLLILIGKLAFAISSIMSLIATIGPAIGGVLAAAAPIVGVIAAIIAIGVLLYKNWDTIKAKALEVKDWVVAKWTALKDGVIGVVTTVKNTVTGAWTTLKTNIVNTVSDIKDKVLFYWEALKTGISIIAKTILSTLTSPFETALGVIKTVIDKIKGLFSGWGIELPHIKLPHFSVDPPGWKLGDLLKGVIPSLGISWWKTGGIFNSPSVIGVGEAGPEAVIPIEKLRDILGNVGGPVINVYGAQGQNINELADIVVNKLIAQQNRRRLAW